eukprot:2252536-Prymnesium_polylepis.2
MAQQVLSQPHRRAPLESPELQYAHRHRGGRAEPQGVARHQVALKVAEAVDEEEVSRELDPPLGQRGRVARIALHKPCGLGDGGDPG